MIKVYISHLKYHISYRTSWYKMNNIYHGWIFGPSLNPLLILPYYCNSNWWFYEIGESYIETILHTFQFPSRSLGWSRGHLGVPEWHNRLSTLSVWFREKIYNKNKTNVKIYLLFVNPFLYFKFIIHVSNPKVIINTVSLKRFVFSSSYIVNVTHHFTRQSPNEYFSFWFWVPCSACF